MALIWVTGVPGTGKSAVAAALAGRGLPAYDADVGFCLWRDRRSGAAVSAPASARPSGWTQQHAWELDARRVRRLGARHASDIAHLCGSVENERDVWALFGHVVCLVADRATLVDRLGRRASGGYGTSAEELALVLSWSVTAEQRYRNYGATIVDATQSIAHVVDAVIDAAHDCEL